MAAASEELAEVEGGPTGEEGELPGYGRGERAALAAVFVASGFSALVYQVVLGRYVQLITGATAYAISATLVAFMLGNSAGAAVGGVWADRSGRPLRLYGLAEIAIGVYCAAFPWLFPWFEQAHLSLVHALAPRTLAGENAIRFAVAAAAFVVPAFAMGVTTPAFARAVAEHPEGRGRWLARLYGWNTLGAAVGALTTAYALVPVVGMVGSLRFGAIVNALVAVVAFRLSRSWHPGALRDAGGAGSGDPALLPGPRARSAAGIALAGLLAAAGFHTVSEQLLADGGGGFLLRLVAAPVVVGLLLLASRRARRELSPGSTGLLSVAFVSGLISFGLEVIWTHLLAILLGNSVYSFGLMLGSLLAGLSIGAAIARRIAEPVSLARRWLGLAFLLGGSAVLVTIELWDLVPQLFLSMAHDAPGFALMGAVSFGVTTLLMLLPTLFLGVAFPLALRAAAADRPGVGATVGGMYSINAVGAVLGSLGAAYWMLPVFGSLASLKALATALILTGGVLLWWLGVELRDTAHRVVWTAGLVWCLFAGASWDFQRLNTAAAIYLGESGAQGGELVYQREDAGGGLTTVVKREGVQTLLTNGKFQGDDGPEIPIEHRLAHLPALFTAGRERALVIGLGTGVTLAALASHGFDDVACAEISPAIVEAARTHFSHVNQGGLDAPGVRLLVEDGRSVLRESEERYDVVSVQINSIWFAGVGSIYSREFYSLVASRLRRNGLLLQWFPVHHLSARNLYLVVNTARAVFPYVSVWRHKHQGFLVASLEPQRLDLASIRRDDARPQAQPYLRWFRSGSLLELVSDLAVADRDVDAFLDSLAQLLRLDRDVVSTDSWPTLEYETPKDVLDNMLYFQNVEVLRRFRSREPPAFRGDPSPREAELARAAFAVGWGDRRSVPRLAALAAQPGPDAATALEWLGLELAGEGGSPTAADEYRDDAAPISAALGAPVGRFGCEPTPRPFSRPLTIPMTLTHHDGEVLEGSPVTAVVDGVVDPATTRGLLLRSAGPTTSLAFDLQAPTRLAGFGIFLRSPDGRVAELLLTGRRADGTWTPLAAGAVDGAAACDEARTVSFRTPTPPVDRLRLSIRGEVDYQQLAIYEAWAR